MIVNMACGADPLDSKIRSGMRLRLLRYLKTHIDGEPPELRAIKRGDQASGNSVIAVEDFVTFAEKHREAKDVGALLIDIAGEWSSTSGISPRPRRRTRKAKVEKAAALESRRRKVLERARKYWPNPSSRPPVRAMAIQLANPAEKLSYAAETIRKILSSAPW
jgi:hypothetical protein